MKGWLTVKQLTAQLQFSSADACRHWLRRQGIASVRRGRVILVDQLDIDAALRRSHTAQSVVSPASRLRNPIAAAFAGDSRTEYPTPPEVTP